MQANQSHGSRYLLVLLRSPKHMKKQVTLRLNKDTIEYFEAMANETGIPYQNLINLYLTECAHSGKKLSLKWAS